MGFLRFDLTSTSIYHPSPFPGASIASFGNPEYETETFTDFVLEPELDRLEAKPFRAFRLPPRFSNSDLGILLFAVAARRMRRVLAGEGCVLRYVSKCRAPAEKFARTAPTVRLRIQS